VQLLLSQNSANPHKGATNRRACDEAHILQTLSSKFMVWGNTKCIGNIWAWKAVASRLTGPHQEHKRPQNSLFHVTTSIRRTHKFG